LAMAEIKIQRDRHHDNEPFSSRCCVSLLQPRAGRLSAFPGRDKGLDILHILRMTIKTLHRKQNSFRANRMQ
jgi:hypothetical protein